MQYSDRARAILLEAQKNQSQLGIVDVLVAITTVECGVGQHVLNEAGVRRPALLDLLSNANPSTVLAVIQRTAEREACDWGHPFVGSEHLLLACLKLLDRMPEAPLIRQAIQIDYTHAKGAILRILGVDR